MLIVKEREWLAFHHPNIHIHKCQSDLRSLLYTVEQIKPDTESLIYFLLLRIDFLIHSAELVIV